MAYLQRKELVDLGFKKLGINVKISNKASIYEPEKIEIGDNCRIDDFCVLSGNVVIGKYCHITPMCLIAGGEPGIYIEDYCTFAYGVKVFAQSDDYSGNTMVGSLIPKKYKNEKFESVTIEKYSVLGTNTVVCPGVRLAEGTASGAMTLFLESNSEWGVYVGSPAVRSKKRARKLLKLVKEFEENNDVKI